ncbi:PQ-loop repeat-containing protein [Candidatus Parcubacteria bacterium]|nr:MAG: PQ-loop repeat-containing protein [Candidatus Parcubacteria bacterium]
MDLAMSLGWLATFLFTICYVPQIIKTVKTQSVSGLSFWLLFIQFIANIVAFCYATLIAQPPLQIKYILALFFLLICMGVYIRVYRKNPPQRQISSAESLPDAPDQVAL